jgi:ubiquinone/menaquinone biosynthesis C-methylase UbiE
MDDKRMDGTPVDGKQLAQERFGKCAASYTGGWHNAAGADLERIAQLVGDHPSWVALDIATGGGHAALAVAPHVARVVATDITEPMLWAAGEFILSRGVANVEFQQADAEDLPFAAATFDLVTCRIAAHHFPDPARFVSEVHRVLRPGGLLVLQDMVAPQDPEAAAWITRFERRRDPSHQRALSAAEWLRLLGASGFSVETDDHFEKRPGLLKWVADQDGTADDLAELRAWLRQAPPAAAEWLHPTDIDAEGAAFSIHHELFTARTSDLGDLGAGC